MGRLGDAWRALTGRRVPEPPGGERAAAPGGETLEGTLLAKLVATGEAPRRGTTELLDCYRTSPWIRAVVGRLGLEVATAFKPVLYSGPRRDRTRREVPRHALLDLLRDPTPAMPARVVWSFVQNCLDLVGNAFLVIDRNAAGYPVELSPVPPHWISATPTRARPFFELSGPSVHRRIDEQDMLWLRDPDPKSPYGLGVGTAASLSDEIDTDEGAAKQTSAFFRNGGLPGAVVWVKGASSPELDRVEETLKAKYSGPKNANRIHTTNKQLGIERIDTSFKDMDLVSLRKWERDAIVEVFGLPPEIFGILENSNRATIDAAYYLFAKAVLVPRLELLVAEIQKKLVPQFGDAVFLDYENPIPEDRDFFMRAVATAPRAFRVREVRERVGLPPDPEIDDEILGTAPVTAGPTNVPPGKSLDEKVAELEAFVKGPRAELPPPPAPVAIPPAPAPVALPGGEPFPPFEALAGPALDRSPTSPAG